MIIRTDISRLLEHNVRTGFLNGPRDYSPIRGAFTREVPSVGAFENYADMGDLPWPQGPKSGTQGPSGQTPDGHAEISGRTNAGGGVREVSAEERGIQVHNVDWEVVIPVSHNAINDARTGDLEQWSRDAAINFERHKDYLAIRALGLGNGTTLGKTYDGLSFFNASHLDPRAEYQTAQGNLLGLALSLDNYETVKVAASKFLDSRGVPMGLTHSLIVGGPELEREIAQITTNREDYGTPNRAMNPYAGRTSSLIIPGGWFSSTAWVIIDPSQTRKPINLQMRQEPNLVIWDDEKAGEGGTRYFKWHARYNVFYGDWRLAFMGNA